MKKTMTILVLCLIIQHSFAQLLIDQTPYIPFRQGKKWGAADKNMTVKIPAKYDEMGPFYYGASLVKLNKKYGIVNGQDQVLLPLEYEYIPNFTYTQGFGFSFVVYHQGKWGVINEKQQSIIALTDAYDHIDFLEDSLNNDFLLAAYTKKGLVKEYTVYTKTGEKIIEKLVADTLFFNEEQVSDFAIEQAKYAYSDDYGVELYLRPASVRTFNQGVLTFVRKVNERETRCALYHVNGKEIIGFDKELKTYKKYNPQEGVLFCESTKLDCQKPNTSYIYNFIEQRFVYTEPFNKIESFEIKNLDKTNTTKKEMVLRQLLNGKDPYSAEYYKIFEDLTRLIYSTTDITVMFNEKRIVFFEKDMKTLGVFQTESGVFECEGPVFVDQQNKYYAVIRVFNDQYRGEGLYCISDQTFVIQPVHKKLRYIDDYSESIYDEFVDTKNITYFNHLLKTVTFTNVDGYRIKDWSYFDADSDHAFNTYQVHEKHIQKLNEDDVEVLALYDTKNERYLTEFIFSKFDLFECGGDVFMIGRLFDKNQKEKIVVINREGKTIIPLTDIDLSSPQPLYKRERECYFIVYDKTPLDTPLGKKPKIDHYINAQGVVFVK